MKRSALLFALFSALITSAQETMSERNFAVKAYNLSTYEVHWGEPGLLRLDDFRRSTFVYLNPTIAIQKRTRRNNFHEVELTRFSFRNEYSATDYYSSQGFERSGHKKFTDLRLRYEYILVIAKNKLKRLSPSLGFSASPYFLQMRYTPNESSSFNTRSSAGGLETYVIPRLNFNLNSRVYFDLNIPLSVFRYELNSSKNENPVIPKHQQTYTYYDLELFRQFYSLRLGVGIRL